jgi:hypothetical protein
MIRVRRCGGGMGHHSVKLPPGYYVACYFTGKILSKSAICISCNQKEMPSKPGLDLAPPAADSTLAQTVQGLWKPLSNRLIAVHPGSQNFSGRTRGWLTGSDSATRVKQR